MPPTEWRTLIPEGPDTLLTVTGIGGRLYAVSSHKASHRVRIHAQDGSFLRDLVLPAVGSVDHDEGGGVFSGVHGGWAGDEVWLHSRHIPPGTPNFSARGAYEGHFLPPPTFVQNPLGLSIPVDCTRRLRPEALPVFEATAVDPLQLAHPARADLRAHSWSTLAVGAPAPDLRR